MKSWYNLPKLLGMQLISRSIFDMAWNKRCASNPLRLWKTTGILDLFLVLFAVKICSNRPFSKMTPTEGGLETGGIDCLQKETKRSRFPPFFVMEDSWKSKMPHNCCVPFCNATSKKNKNLRFHRFPKKREQKDRWISKIRRDEGEYFAVTENTRICSKNFCEDDYTVSEDGKARR